MEKDIRSLIKRTFKVFLIVYLLDTSEVINPGGQDFRFLLFLIELFLENCRLKTVFSTVIGRDPRANCVIMDSLKVWFKPRCMVRNTPYSKWIWNFFNVGLYKSQRGTEVSRHRCSPLLVFLPSSNSPTPEIHFQQIKTCYRIFRRIFQKLDFSCTQNFGFSVWHIFLCHFSFATSNTYMVFSILI